jgi:hypothetical protein
MDGPKITYQGISITPQLQQFAEREWRARFTLEIRCGPVTDMASYSIGGLFATREEAFATAIKAARSFIDQISCSEVLETNVPTNDSTLPN